MIDLESTISDAIGSQVPPSVQRSRDVDRVKILQNERQIELGNPDVDARTKNLAALDTMIRSAGGQSPQTTSKIDLEDTISAALKQPAQPAGTTPARAPSMGDKVLDVAKSAVGATAAPARSALEVAGSQLSDVGHVILGGWRGLSALAFGAGIDEAVRQVQNPELAGGATARAYEPAEGSAAAVANRVVGAPGEVVGYLGRTAGRATMDVTGSPAAATAVETGVNAVPLAFLRTGKRAPAPVPRTLPAPTAAAITDATNYDVPTYLRRRQEVPAVQAEQPNTKAPEPTVNKDGVVEPMPVVEKFEETPPPPSGKALPQEAQAQRAQVLKDVGLTGEVRKSAVAGDQVAANTEANAARLESPAGNVIRAQLENERKTLTNYGEQIVRDTGGSIGTDSGANYARGNTIIAPLDGLKTFFKAQTDKLYAEARAKAAGQPVTVDRFNGKMGENSSFTGNTDTLQLREGIKDRMKELGMADEKGNPIPATVDQVENLRKYIGERWTKNSNKVIRDLKQSLDQDVSAAAGEDTFAKARTLHAMKAATLDDPKGIAKIMDSEGPSGVNRAVDIEKIPDTLTSMGVDQLAHVVKTLRNVPAELQPQAQAALAEIKAHFANKVLEAGSSRVGQWGARDVTKYLNNNAQRLAQVFSPDELGKFRTLNDAGHILKIEGGYPGAAVQEHNLVRSRVMTSLRSIAAGAGSFIGGAFGPLGAAVGAGVGDLAGAAATRKLDTASQVNAAKSRMVNLSEFPK